MVRERVFSGDGVGTHPLCRSVTRAPTSSGGRSRDSSARILVSCTSRLPKRDMPILLIAPNTQKITPRPTKHMSTINVDSSISPDAGLSPPLLFPRTITRRASAAPSDASVAAHASANAETPPRRAMTRCRPSRRVEASRRRNAK